MAIHPGSGTPEAWPRGRARDGGVDQVSLPDLPGALWLCGKHVVGPDPDAALARVGATTVVCLNERHELEDRYPRYVGWLELEEASRARWYPIADLDAPGAGTVGPFLAELARRLRCGERLLVHCGAGIGRAGTIAVGTLMTLGVGRDEALRTVVASRPSAGPEVGVQRELVDDLAVVLGQSAPNERHRG